jgi:hypothetical protein
MAIPNWQRTIVTESGAIVPNAEIKVVVESTGLDADIFSDRAGTTPLSNPFFTGSDGFAEFYAEAGTYRITATGPSGTRTWRYEVLFGLDTDFRVLGDVEFFGEADFSGPFEFSGNGEFSGNIDLSGDVTITTTPSTLIRDMIRYGKPVGEMFGSEIERTPTAFNPATPDTYFPALPLTTFSGVQTISETNWPDLLPALRDVQLKIGSTSTFAGSASASTITLTDTTANNQLLSALAESITHFGYNYTVTWGGTEFAITNIATLTRVITVTGTPTAGAGNATFFPHRIAGSTTTARVFSLQGLGLIGLGDADRYFVGGLARRGYMQGHKHEQTKEPSSDAFGLANISRTRHVVSGTTTVGFLPLTGSPWEDGNGTPRTAKTTNGPSWSVHIYQHGGRYIA